MIGPTHIIVCPFRWGQPIDRVQLAMLQWARRRLDAAIAELESA